MMQKRNALIAFLVVIVLALFTINLRFITPAHAGDKDHDILFTLGRTTYTVDGQEKELDVAPYTKGGRTYIPVRYLAQALGARIQWDEGSQTVWLFKDKKIRLIVGSSVMTLDDKEYQLDVEPVITSGRTMLPARWAAEALGYGVDWNEAAKTIHIRPAKEGEVLLQLSAPKPPKNSWEQGIPEDVVWLENLLGVKMQKRGTNSWYGDSEFLDVSFKLPDENPVDIEDKLTIVDIYLIPQDESALKGQKFAPISDYQKAREIIKKYIPSKADEIYKKFNDCVYLAKTKGYEIEDNTKLNSNGTRGKSPAIEMYHSLRNGPSEIRLLMLLP